MIISHILGRMTRAIKRHLAFHFSVVDDVHADDFTVINGKLMTWREFNAQARASYKGDEHQSGAEESGQIVRHARVVSR